MGAPGEAVQCLQNSAASITDLVTDPADTELVTNQADTELVADQADRNLVKHKSGQIQTRSATTPVTNQADTRRFCIYQDCFWVDFSQYTIQNL